MMRRRITVGALLLAAVGCAAIALYYAMVGVPRDDPWLFPMLVALPALLSSGFAVALALRPSFQTSVALLSVSLLCGLYAIDAVLELVPDRAELMPDRIASARGAPIDHRTRLEFAAALRAEGVNAYVSLPADILRSSKAHGGARITRNGRTIVPLAQLRNGVIVHCNESGRYSVFRTDEWGFNNRPGAWRLPVEVAAIGDSYVQGACVDSTETLVANLRQEMPAILSVGLDGAGPLSMLGLVKEYLPRVKPRKVLWFYYEGNDLTDLTSELQVPQLRAYLEPGRVQGLPEYAAALDSAIVSAYPHLQSMTPAPRDNSVGFTTKLGRWARLNRLRRAVALGDVAERVDMCCDLDAFGAVLAEANRTVESWGGRLYIVYLPAPGRSLRPLAGIFTDQLRYRSRVLRLIRRMGLPVIDVYPAFQRVDDPSVLFFGTQSHYTATGYKIAADEVVRQLEQSIH